MAEAIIEEKRELAPLLKIALELGPLVTFFIANTRGDYLIDNFEAFAGFGEPIFLATAAFMVAFFISLTVTYALVRKLPIMPMVSGVVVLIFGGLTLYLQDDLFIKLKPTIVNVMFGSVLLVGLMFQKPLLEYVFADAFKLHHEGWVKLSFRWGIFFFFLALLNEITWRNFSTDFWVAFKVWGVFPITMVFTMFQLPLLKRYGIEEEEAAA